MTEPVLRRRIRHLWQRPFRENVFRLRLRLTLTGRRMASQLRVSSGRDYLTARHLSGVLKPGRAVQDIGKRVRDGSPPCCFVRPAERPDLAAAIERMQPGAAAAAVSAAEGVMRHEFDLLGSGPVELGESIDWHRDFKSGYRWPDGVHYERIDGRYLIPDSDIKVPWELSRAQFLPTLGRAYCFTGDERYPAEFVRLVEHWLAHNRPEAGVNWSCAMDVAIRAVNWLWAYQLMADSPVITDEFEVRLWAGLYEHGRFLARNLEGLPGDVNSNHYLSDIAGLLFLGLLLPEFKEADTWRAIGEAGLVKEMDDQVLPDGADWEMSTSYHRLVTEMLLTCGVLCERNGVELPDRFSERLSLMIDYTFAYTRPDGTVPIIGDADNGRLQRLTTWRETPLREFHDHRHLLAAGAVLYDRADWAAAADGCWEEALWLFGADAEEQGAFVAGWFECRHAPSRGALMPPASTSCGRLGSYSIAKAGADGVRGSGGHMHNDLLSFEVFANGQPFVVDPGSYVYTADAAERNAFRSSLIHNGVVVDGREINRFDPDVLFEVPLESAPIVERWVTDEKKDLLVASHSGYRTLADPGDRQAVVAVRQDVGAVDRLGSSGGGGAHSYFVPVQFSPGLEVSKLDGSAAVRARAPHGPWLDLDVLVDPGLDVTVDEGWVARSYGTRSRAPRVEFRFTASGPQDFVWTLVPSEPASEESVVAGAPLGGPRLESAKQLFRDLDPAFPLGGH